MQTPFQFHWTSTRLSSCCGLLLLPDLQSTGGDLRWVTLKASSKGGRPGKAASLYDVVVEGEHFLLRFTFLLGDLIGSFEEVSGTAPQPVLVSYEGFVL